MKWGTQNKNILNLESRKYDGHTSDGVSRVRKNNPQTVFECQDHIR